MRCSCGGRVRVTHTFQASPAGKTQSAHCERCAKRYTIVSVLRPNEKHGQGAYATARRLRRRLQAPT